jgi:hypothetical protein
VGAEKVVRSAHLKGSSFTLMPSYPSQPCAGYHALGPLSNRTLKQMTQLHKCCTYQGSSTMQQHSLPQRMETRLLSSVGIMPPCSARRFVIATFAFTRAAVTVSTPQAATTNTVATSNHLVSYTNPAGTASKASAVRQLLSYLWPVHS